MIYRGYIYITFNQQTKLNYVGRRVGLPEKTQGYLGSGKYFNNAINKYGKQFFKKRILGCLSADTKKELKKILVEAETECIYFFRTFGADGENYDEIYGYNLTPNGAAGGDTRSNHPNKNAILQQQSKSMKKYWETADRKQKSIEMKKGLNTETAKINNHNKMKKRWSDENYRTHMLPILHESAKKAGQVNKNKTPHNYINFSTEQIQQMKIMHNNGIALKKIGEFFGCSKGVISKRLATYKKLGIPMEYV